MRELKDTPETGIRTVRTVWQEAKRILGGILSMEQMRKLETTYRNTCGDLKVELEGLESS